MTSVSYKEFKSKTNELTIILILIVCFVGYNWSIGNVSYEYFIIGAVASIGIICVLRLKGIVNLTVRKGEYAMSLTELAVIKAVVTVGLGLLSLYIFFVKGIFGMYLYPEYFSWLLLLYQILIIVLSSRLILAVAKIQTVYNLMTSDDYAVYGNTIKSTHNYEEVIKEKKVRTKKNTNNKVSTVIGNIFRWLVALIALPLLVWLVFLIFVYPFEWLLSITTKWRIFFHVGVWIMFGCFFMWLVTVIGSTVSTLFSLLVRQTVPYMLLLFLGLLALAGFCVYGAWSNNIMFSWEIYKYSTFNKITFTILMLNVLYIPIPIITQKEERLNEYNFS